MTMKEKEIHPISCLCQNHWKNLDVFKESGAWIIVCHECDRLEYSEHKARTIIKWNENTEKDRNRIGESHVTLKNEIYEGMHRWIHNMVVRWKKEYGQPMTENEIEDLESLFILQLEDKNTHL